MSAAPGSQEAEAARRRRRIISGIAIAIVVIALLVIGTTVAVWLFFVGSEAPAAPTLNDALQVLQSPAAAE